MTSDITVTETTSFRVRVDPELAARCLAGDIDSEDLSLIHQKIRQSEDRFSGVIDADMTFDDGEVLTTGWWEPKPIDLTGPERRLWHARSLVAEARGELGRARYHEAPGPVLDGINNQLMQIEETLRKLATERDATLANGPAEAAS